MKTSIKNLIVLARADRWFRLDTGWSVDGADLHGCPPPLQNGFNFPVTRRLLPVWKGVEGVRMNEPSVTMKS